VRHRAGIFQNQRTLARSIVPRVIGRSNSFGRDAGAGPTLMRVQKTSLKILHVLEHGLALNSGYGFRSLNIVRSQSKRGWEPVVLTFPNAYESAKGSWQQPEIVKGINFYYRPLSVPWGRLFLRRRRISSLVNRIRQIMEVEKPDLLHAHSPVDNGVAALHAGRKLKVPVVYEIRSLWEEAGVAHGTYEYHSHQFRQIRTLETRVCQRVDQVAVISNRLRDHLIDRGIRPDKISVVPNGVDLETMKPCGPDAEYQETWKLKGKQIVAYIGSFRRYEGLDLLIGAIAYLSKSRRDIVLLLVGGGRLEAESELRALVERFDLREKVIMPGWLPPDRIPGVYALTDVLVYPRKRMLLTDVVTPLKPLEAMAMGKALIASDVGGHRELIRSGHNGVLFPAGNESALADAIVDLLDDHDLRRRLAAQSATWVQKRSWNETTSVYAEIYGNAQEVNSSRFLVSPR
jgi:PEP-CTERM/exosortase A-associated glycosyltransferase